MPVVISVAEAKAFAMAMQRPEYARDERDYKVAVHAVFSRLLSPPLIDSPDFPRILKSTLEGAPDFERLGLRPEERDAVVQATKPVGDFRNAFANLCGGRWGVAQYIWMLPAVDLEFGDSLRAAFKGLVNTDEPLAGRVDGFRLELYEIQKQVRDKGGFKPGWSLLNVALGFVGAVLGAYDPARYTFYHATRLKRSIEHLGAEWPQGTAGHRYAGVCELVRQAGDALKTHGVPVRDLIDAQSFLWLKAQKLEAPLTAPLRQAVASASLSIAEMATELAGKTFWDRDRAERLVRVAQRSKQLLFYGPPGTGKTYVALILARLLAGDQEEGHVRLAQFHPSYAYEDFVEGIRPKLRGAEALGYEVRKGVLRRLIDQAREFPEERFFLVIDEMNRANLPRVFGELLFGLEYRGPEYLIDLPYSEEAIYIPENFWVVGTMNTADRSIALVDAALRRRFTHVEFSPDPKTLKRWLEAHRLGDLAEDAVKRLDALNAELKELLDPDRLIGHSYLMREDLRDVGFETVWTEELEPVLREHLFSRPEELERLKATFLKSG
jgi:MoxR-like ATPase